MVGGGCRGLALARTLVAEGHAVRAVTRTPARRAEIEVQNEIDDMDQMREAVNRRRRARGEAELTEEHLRARVAEDHAETLRLRQRREPPS